MDEYYQAFDKITDGGKIFNQDWSDDASLGQVREVYH